MFSSTSSSNLAKAALCFGLFFIMFASQEMFIRDHRWGGGFMTVVDHDESNEIFSEASKQNDIVIIGSSRAKEAIRPTLLNEAYGMKSYNSASHSSTSLDMTHTFINWLMNGTIKSSVKHLIVTLEPLHFSEKYTIMGNSEDKINLTKGNSIESIKCGFWCAARNLNATVQKKTNKAISDIIYVSFKASAPTERRKLHLWVSAVIRTIWSVLLDGKNLLHEAADNFEFAIVGKDTRHYTRVIAHDHGYEGHMLFIAHPSSSRAVAFSEHMNIYRNWVLPAYSTKFHQVFADDLAKIKEYGINIILLRLPIYRDLHEIEQAMVPSFTTDMQAVADEVGVPYLDGNILFPELITNNMAFTDASHMEHTVTGEFSEKLVEILRPYIQ